MGSDLGSQGDSRERKFADAERAVNSKLETKKSTTSVTHIIAINTNFKSLYFRAYNNAFKILED